MESIKKPPNLRSSRNRYIPKIERTSPQNGKFHFIFICIAIIFLHVIMLYEIHLCLNTII